MNAPHDIPDDRSIAVPPHSGEAEQSVLGALLFDNDAYDRITDLRAEHFYRYDHRMIFECIAKLILAGRNADVITVHEALEATGKGEQIGGLAYLNTLSQNAPGSAGIRRWAEIVINRAKLRGLISAADEISAMAYQTNGREVEEIIAEAQGKLEPLADQATREPAFLNSFLSSIIKRIDDEFHERGTVRKAYSTGLRDLDAKLGGGLRGGQLVIIAGRPSMGKAQPVNAKVRTFSGWASMGDLKIGDSLASIDGAESIVTGIYPQGVKKVFQVTFSDGRSTEACAEHLWRVHHRKWSTPKILSTAEIESMLCRPDMVGRLWIDSISGNFGNDEILPIDPWLLGALLGDGDFTQRTMRFSKGETEILERIRRVLPGKVELVHAGGCEYRLSNPNYVRGIADSNPLTKALSGLGLLGEKSQTKFIPSQYLYGSRETRLGVLQGLLDTDGWVEKFGSVRFSTSSRNLADGVVELVRSLGFWCSENEKATSYIKNGIRHECCTAYTMTISGYGLNELFIFSKKMARCSGRTRGKRIAFKSITSSRETECQCISVSHPSHLYITNDYIVTHNTAIALGVSEAVAETGETSLFCTQEMVGEELAARSLSRASGLPLDKILNGAKFGKGNDDPDWSMLTHGATKLANLALLIDETAGVSLSEIQARARAAKRKHGLGLIVVDYLGLMAATQGNNRTEQVGANSRGLKTLAKQLNVPIVLLAQLSRKCEERTNKRPIMSDLRDSGEIEQDADVILFLYRDEVYNPDSVDVGTAEINVAKQRNGPTGVVRAAYFGERTMFADLVAGYTPPPTPRKAPEKARRGFE